MTTARELAKAMYQDDYQTTDVIADRLIAIIDKRIQEVAELREKENQCSNTSSAVSSPRVSFSSATTSTEAERTAVATKPVAPTESTTHPTKSGAKSLDERAEALFAANPGIRPVRDGMSLRYHNDMGGWFWINTRGDMRTLECYRNDALLSALLPRAIAKWWSGSRHIESSSSVFGWKLTRAFSGGPPRDLESAIRVLEGK